jgi:hypothetical protein
VKKGVLLRPPPPPLLARGVRVAPPPLPAGGVWPTPPPASEVRRLVAADAPPAGVEPLAEVAPLALGLVIDAMLWRIACL